MDDQRDSATLNGMVQAASFILEFQQGLDWVAFTADFKTQSAIIHQFLVMGEAVKRLTKEFRTLHPEVPWSDITGMSDTLIHDYDKVNIEEVWKAATIDVPALLPLIEPLLPEQNEL